VSETDAVKAEADKRREAEDARRAKLRAAFDRGDPQGIAQSFTSAPRGETFEQAIARGNAWLDAMIAKGHASGGRCVERVHDPISREEADVIEGELAFALPPSFRRFLTEVGQVRFLNPWGDETVAPFELAAATARFAAEIARLAAIHPASGRCVYVCDFHNHDAHYFLSCAERDDAGESPVHLLFHDESELYDGTFGFDAWFSEKVTRTIEEETKRIVRR